MQVPFALGDRGQLGPACVWTPGSVTYDRAERPKVKHGLEPQQDRSGLGTSPCIRAKCSTGHNVCTTVGKGREGS